MDTVVDTFQLIQEIDKSNRQFLEDVAHRIEEIPGLHQDAQLLVCRKAAEICNYNRRLVELSVKVTHHAKKWKHEETRGLLLGRATWMAQQVLNSYLEYDRFLERFLPIPNTGTAA